MKEENKTDKEIHLKRILSFVDIVNQRDFYITDIGPKDFIVDGHHIYFMDTEKVEMPIEKTKETLRDKQYESLKHNLAYVIGQRILKKNLDQFLK